MASGGSVSSFSISPDGSHVVYKADQDTDDVCELYRVPIDGSANPVKLNRAMIPGGDVCFYDQMSPDASVVFFTARHDEINRIELYAGDGAGPPMKLNDPLVLQGHVARDMYLLADGSWLIFRAAVTVSYRTELFRVPTDGIPSTWARRHHLGSRAGLRLRSRRIRAVAPRRAPGRTLRPVRGLAGPRPARREPAAEADDHEGRERLARHLARPPIVSEHLSLAENGRVVYALRRHWKDGPRAVVFAPLDFIARLAALVPRPKTHLLTYHGVLAPAAESASPGGAR